MRIESFNPNKFDQTFENIAVGRLVDAAEVVKAAAYRKCPTGTVSRPMYQSGPYAGQPWTARDAGQLKKSVRVVRQRTKSGKALSKKRNVRIYAGHTLAFYAAIVEHSKPYMRTGLAASLGEVKEIIGAR